MNFKYPSNLNADALIDKSNASSMQDLFVVAMFNGKHNGTFLEIGANHPVVDSNCYLLESEFNYSGTSIDLYDTFERFTEPFSWKELRPNTNFVKSDASTFDYTSIPNYVDYLQIDLDQPKITFDVLERITNSITFGVLTLEHNLWRGNYLNQVLPKNKNLCADIYNYKNKCASLLKKLGYTVLVNNVGFDQDGIFHSYEDWYINLNIVSKEIIDAYKWITCDHNAKDFKKVLFN